MTRLIRALALVLLVGSSQSALGADAVANPAVAGPVTGGTHGQPFGAMTAADLAKWGYSEKEYFYAGSARAYEKEGAWGMDGIWNLKPGASADYKVRFVVRRPA